MALKEFCYDLTQNPLVVLLGIFIGAIGFAAAFLALLLYMLDYRIDRSYPDYQNIYRVESHFTLPNGEHVHSAQVPLPLAEALQKQFGLGSVGIALRLTTSVRSKGRITSGAEVFAVNPEFMRRLNPFQQALPPLAANEIIITPAFNQQFLDMDAPRGQVIELGNYGNFVIKEVVDPRPDSSFILPAMIAFSPALVSGYDNKRINWLDNNVLAFIHVTTAKWFVNVLLDRFLIRYMPQFYGEPLNSGVYPHFRARNVLDLHYDADLHNEFTMVVSRSLLNILYASALLLVLVTAANFLSINGVIQTAKLNSPHTMPCIGASDNPIMADYLKNLGPQFLSIIAVAIVMITGFALFSDTVSALFNAASVWLLVSVFGSATFMMGCLLLAIQTLYLRFFIFRANARRAYLRVKNSTSCHMNNISLVFHLLLSGTVIYIWAGVTAQSHYAVKADYGYKKKNRLIFELNPQIHTLGVLRGLRNRLKDAAGISSVALSSWRPFDPVRHDMAVGHARQKNADHALTIYTFAANREFPAVWQLETVAGEENEITVSQDPRVAHVIATRAFVNSMGQSSYDEVLNSTFYIEEEGKKRALRVLRIVENLYPGKRTQSPPPVMIFIEDNLEKYGSVLFATPGQRHRIMSVLRDYGIGEAQIRSVDELHHQHFRHSLSLLRLIAAGASLSLIVMFANAITIGLAEAARLRYTQMIMKAAGGPAATDILFFLRRHLVALTLSFTLALAAGFWLLQAWLSRCDSVSGLTHTYAIAALAMLVFGVTGLMTSALLAGSGRFPMTRGRKRWSPWT
jgi:putative ABC transport system permease protein